MKVFSVYDSKAEAHLNPFPMKTTGEALRAFESACKNPDSQFNKFPSDYTLKEIAVWDEITGSISSIQHAVIANASEYVH